METQSPFNLIAAIENWRRELVTQPGVTPEDCRELEAHLNDSIAQLRKLGLPEEEAFWLARRRLGLPQEISNEFVKENPAKIWRDRLLWIGIAVLGLQLWESICFSLTSPLVLVAMALNSVPPWLDGLRQMNSLIGNELIYSITAIWFAIQIRRCRMGWLLSVWEFLCVSRVRFLSVAIPLVLFLFSLENFSILPFGEFVGNARNDDLVPTHTFRDFGYMFLVNGISPLAMVGFIAWLIPARENHEPEMAH